MFDVPSLMFLGSGTGCSPCPKWGTGGENISGGPISSPFSLLWKLQKLLNAFRKHPNSKQGMPFSSHPNSFHLQPSPHQAALMHFGPVARVSSLDCPPSFLYWQMPTPSHRCLVRPRLKFAPHPVWEACDTGHLWWAPCPSFCCANAGSPFPPAPPAEVWDPRV